MFNGCEVSVWGDGKVLEIDSVWWHNNMNVLNATELYTLTWLKW